MFKFIAEKGMEKAETMTKDKREVIIQKTEICNLGRARYKEELIVDGLNPYILSEGFKNAVKALPDSYDEREYLQFIERWGTVRQ